MTCKDCLHGDMCEGYIPTDLDKDVWHYCREGRADQIPDIEERCSSFEDRTKYVEVVRCKDCTHYRKSEHNSFVGINFCYVLKDCNKTNIGFIRNDNDFCSRGERREGK